MSQWRRENPKAERNRYRRDAGVRKKRIARVIAGRAKRNGRLEQKPCEECGAPNAEIHHEDYDRPLDVRWLCSDCHGAEHYPEARPSESVDRLAKIAEKYANR